MKPCLLRSVLLIGLAAQAGAGSRSLEHLQQAQELSAAGQQHAAVASVRQALRLEPSSGEAHHLLGQLLASLGDLAAARQSFAEVTRLNPTSAGAWANLGYIQSLDGRRPSDVEKSYQTALRLEPEHLNSIKGLAELKQAQSDYAGAEKLLLEALRKAKAAKAAPAPSLYLSLASLYEDLGKDEKAAKAYKAALKLDASIGLAHLGLGRLQHKHGKLRASEKSYRKAIEFVPEECERFDIYKWLGIFLAARGANEEATKVLTRAVQLRREAGRLTSSLIMNLPDEALYLETRRKEAASFADACRVPALRKLPLALAAVRSLESDEAWLVPFLLESVAVFGLSQNRLGTASSFGSVWFIGFRRVMETAHAHSSRLASERPVTFVMGSGLGEQCFFAAALGMSCVGYDVLCNSTVSQARRIVSEHQLEQLSIRHLCGSAVESEGLEEAAAVFLNDYSFEQPLHEQLELHLARNLRPGAIVASFSPWNHETGFAVVATVEVETSWGDVPVEIRLKKEICRGPGLSHKVS
ncbi:Tmtc4, partial [Symbiodinium microadriaticum]